MHLKIHNPSLEDSEFLDIAVLAGGSSAERDVSLASGRAVVEALHARGHFATILDPAEVDLFSINWREFDVCFVALHGGAGENGNIQLQLEEIGIPYTGSSPIAASLAMSKTNAKERFLQYDVPTPSWQTFRATSPATEIIETVVSVGLPAVIKPDSQGSSLGVSVAETPDDIIEAVQVSRQFESCLIAERLIEGREFTVSVFDGQPLPVLEIDHGGEVFDHDTKLSLPSCSVRPLESDNLTGNRVSHVAVEAAAALGTCGLVRVDIMVDQDERPWVLEVNAVPGLTEHSLAPLAAKHAGLNMSDLCDSMVRVAMSRAALELKVAA